MPRDATQLNKVPTVSRVAGDTIIELVYDRTNRTTGLVVSRFGGLWNIEQDVRIEGELLVPYSPCNNLIAHDCVLLPSRPEEFGSVSGLVADIEAFLHRYVDLSPIFERIASHYVLLSWVHDAFSEVPYLRLQGAYGSGKTRGLIAIGSLCYKPFFAAGASTVSPIFHTLDRFGGTLVLDEADFRFTDATADLVKVLNNGTVKGLPVLRTIQDRNREFNPAAFKVFGPKLIAMRGSFDDDALESRFLTEVTGTRPLRADIPLQLPAALHEEARVLRNRLLHFRLCSLFSITAKPELASPALDPRLNQISLPLLSLVDDPALRRDIQTLLSSGQQRWREDRSLSIEARVLRATLEAMSGATAAGLPVQAIADRLSRSWQPEMGRAPSAKLVGGVLKSAFRIQTRKSHGVYVVSVEDRTKLEAMAVQYHIPADANV
ncbi:MAG TPA: hypothetical protein VHU23_00815 [Rhizomicrobium sp.]|nr:hypothetical protein [Rhizomicrobium sp.]